MRTIVAWAVLMAASASAQDIELQTPRGGWNVAGLVDDQEKLAVAYPPALIDRGTQKGRFVIGGRLIAEGETSPRGTLVVNGNPMPLYTGADGRFARPYALGAGSNGVEIRSAAGQRRRVQSYESDPNRRPADVRIILGWDDDQAEVDLHVVTPDGQHAFFGDPVLKNGGGLDVDSVDGPGPEMFTLIAPVHGAYHVYVNYWGNFGDNGYHFDEKTRKRDVITTTITLVFHENTLREKRETFVVPLRKIGDLNLVKSFLY